MAGPDLRIAVIGLGYVGLPLTIALARHFQVVAFDIDATRIAELRDGFDRTREVDQQTVAQSAAHFTDDEADLRAVDVFVVTVPTPVDVQNRPDLSALMAATATVARSMEASRRPTIVYESTVFPGVTEDICGPELERISGCRRGRDFRLAYSPERINPGDKARTIDSITKVIAGEDADVVEQIAGIYGTITDGGIFRAASIKAAEAAKAIENAQRDINIAFMNEVAQILSRIDVSVWDVLAAARTKWNFLPFEPGLVGGHCIGVDPYYLSHLAQHLGHDPQVILAGRETNDGMGTWIADKLHEHRQGRSGNALVLGLTFKENVPDLRNSRVFDLVGRLRELGHDVSVHDPLADPQEIVRAHNLHIREPNGTRYDLVIGAVAHDAYRSMGMDELDDLVAPSGTLADLKGMWRDLTFAKPIDRWTL